MLAEVEVLICDNTKHARHSCASRILRATLASGAYDQLDDSLAFLRLQFDKVKSGRNGDAVHIAAIPRIAEIFAGAALRFIQKRFD